MLLFTDIDKWKIACKDLAENLGLNDPVFVGNAVHRVDNKDTQLTAFAREAGIDSCQPSNRLGVFNIKLNSGNVLS